VQLYNNTVIGTLVVDGRAGAPPSPLLAVPNVTASDVTEARRLDQEAVLLYFASEIADDCNRLLPCGLGR